MQKETKTPIIDELAKSYRSKLKTYRCEYSTPIENLTDAIELFEATIEQLQTTQAGLFTPLMRVVAHYAATSQDGDKDAVIEYITGYGGVTRLLERVQADREIIDNMQLLLECLTEVLDNSKSQKQKTLRV